MIAMFNVRPYPGFHIVFTKDKSLHKSDLRAQLMSGNKKSPVSLIEDHGLWYCMVVFWLSVQLGNLDYIAGYLPKRNRGKQSQCNTNPGSV